MSELDQVESFISQTTFEGLKKVLLKYAEELKELQVTHDHANSDKPSPVVTESAEPVPIKTLPDPIKTDSNPTIKPFVPNLEYNAIESFAWDQGEYNSPTVSIYIELPGVGSVKERVSCDFTSTSFDLKIMNFNGKSHRLIKDNLEKEILPETSKFIVKKDRIIIKLQKVKGEYSYEHWAKLTSTKSTKEKEAQKKDPSAGLMDMMKDMYNDGDENMKKIIGEAMLKSQNERLEKGAF